MKKDIHKYQGKILIVDDSKTTRQEVKKALQDQYTIYMAENGLQVLQQVAKHPDLICIIMDLMMPHLDGLKTTHILKSNFQTYHIPIIVLTSQIAIEDMILAVKMGADDYMRKPFDATELKARIAMNIRRTERDQNSNPLTKLPGNAIINRTILQRLEQPIAVLYADLDNFKAYNDKYGFTKGDDVLTHTAKVLSLAVKKHGNSSDFLGHIGGDDFIIISTPEKSVEISEAICEQLDKNIETFYNEQDRKGKSIISYDRLGNQQEFPLVSISIAIVTNEKKELTSTPQIAQIAAELKHFAKTKPHGKLGSNYVKDRRSN